MNIIKNNQPLSAETLFDILKKEFAEYINHKLDANLSIEYAHVYDIINVSFPEVIEGTVFTITVTDDDLIVSVNATDSEYNIELLEQHLTVFLEEKCS
jgi:hypothetical protein